jgi:hypothetical protein
LIAPLSSCLSRSTLNRQSESYARDGIDLDVSTLADWVGACTAAWLRSSSMVTLRWRRPALGGHRLADRKLQAPRPSRMAIWPTSLPRIVNGHPQFRR